MNITHTDIVTYRPTHIHTDTHRQTDRQTDINTINQSLETDPRLSQVRQRSQQ